MLKKRLLAWLTSLFFLGVLAISLTSMPKVSAASCSWTGGVDEKWSTPGNWSAGCSGTSGIPGTNDDLTFPTGTLNAGMDNDLTGLTINSLTFGAKNYLLDGNALNLVSGLTTTSGGQTTISIDLTLTENQTFTANDLLAVYGTINRTAKTLTIATNYDVQMVGNLTGTGALNIVGSSGHRVILAGTNTFTGDITISGFVDFRLTNSSAAGNSNNVITNEDIAAIIIEGDSLVIPNTFHFAENTTLYNLGNNNTLTGNIIVVGNITNYVQTGDLTISGIISGGKFSKYGTGTLTLAGSASNTFTGGLEVQQGPLVLNKTSATAVSSTLTIGDNTEAAETAVLTQSSNDQIADGIAVILNSDGYWNETYNERVGSIAGTGKITIDAGKYIMTGGNQSSTTFSGILTGAGEIQKIGTGTFTLTAAAPDFTGTASTAEGKLIINGNMSNTAGVMNGGILGGSGTVKSILSYDGGIAPGTGPGILHVVNGTTLSSATTATFELNGATAGTGYDQISTTGNININNAPLALSMGYYATPGTVFTLLTTTGTISSTFTGHPNFSSFTVEDNEFMIEYKENTVEVTAIATLLLKSFKSTPSTVTVGKPITLSIKWGSRGAPTPTGTTTFMEGTTTLGTKTLNSNGEATLVLSNLSVGTHTFKATYNGNGDFNPAITGPITIRVIPLVSTTSTVVSATPTPETTVETTELTPTNETPSVMPTQETTQQIAPKDRNSINWYLVVFLTLGIMGTGYIFYRARLSRN